MVYEQLHNFISLIKIICLINLYPECQLIFKMHRKYQSISKIFEKTFIIIIIIMALIASEILVLHERHVVISNQIANIHDKNN